MGDENEKRPRLSMGNSCSGETGAVARGFDGVSAGRRRILKYLRTENTSFGQFIDLKKRANDWYCPDGNYLKGVSNNVGCTRRGC
ncbi:MAG: hypothetical protein HY541_04700 [Deltaproteobacteria bacterium]|nr:hypothetical protein [Deltaproteobacteria bacterium]